MKTPREWLAVAGLTCGAIVCPGARPSFHVTTTGSDQAEDSSDRPFEKPARAHREREFPFPEEPWATYFHLERSYDLDAGGMAAHRQWNKPVFNGEDRYESDHAESYGPSRLKRTGLGFGEENTHKHQP